MTDASHHLPTTASDPLDGAETAGRTGPTDRLELVSEIAADLLMADGSPDRLVRRAYERLADHLGLEIYVNYLIDPERRGLRLQSCAGIDEETVKRLAWLDFGEAVCGTVASDGQRRVLEHVGESDAPITAFIREIGVRAYACQALVAGGRTIGTLSFGTRRRDSFRPDELDLMQTVSDLAAAAFDRAALLSDLEGRASTLDEIARFQSLLLNSMSQAVIATDEAGRVTAWNRRAEELYGWTAAEAAGRSVYELTVPEVNQDAAEEVMSTLASGVSWSGEFMVARRDGTTFLARVQNAPLRDASGRQVGIIGLSEDITEERRREAEELREQERRAEWLSFASHELRSPLTSLVGYTSRLRRRADADEGLAGVREELEVLAAEAQRMERSIELVLKVAALDTGDVRLEREPLYVADLVEEEAGSVRKRDPRAGIELRGLREHLSITSDEGAIRLILRNLLDNAAKYGGDPPTITVELETSEEWVSVTVTDNGDGIPEADVPRVFDRYYRGAAASSGSPGLGLGLYISQRLSELLGGRLSATNAPDGGAAFRLTLPLQENSGGQR